MATVGSVVVNFFASTADYIKGLKTVKSETSNTLEDIRKSFGKRSAIGEVTELLKGAGVVGGLGLALRDASEGFDKVRETLDAIEAGTKTTADLWREIGRSIPIVGKFTFSLGDLLLRGALTPKQIKTDAQSEAAKAQELNEAMVKSLQDKAKAGSDELDVAVRAGVDRAIKQLEVARDEKQRTFQDIADAANKLPAGQGVQASIDAMKGQQAADIKFQEDAENILRTRRKIELEGVEAVRRARELADQEEVESMMRLNKIIERQNEEQARTQEQFNSEFNNRLRDTAGGPAVVERRTSFTIRDANAGLLPEQKKQTGLLDAIRKAVEATAQSGIEVVDLGTLTG